MKVILKEGMEAEEWLSGIIQSAILKSTHHFNDLVRRQIETATPASMQQDMPEWVKTSEAKKILNVSTKKLQQIRRDHLRLGIVILKDGRNYKYLRSSLEKYNNDRIIKAR